MPGFELFDDEEKKQVNDVMETGILFRHDFDTVKHGKCKARAFELELASKLNVKYAHLCSSGTAALSAALSVCGIGLGDEVVVPPFTFIATIEAVILAGATPVFAEIDETLCLCPDDINKVLTNKTKAVLIVHMCGSMAKINTLRSICKSKKIILIEDACQALGGTFNGQSLGSFGEVGCFSFDFVKTITCGEGGAIITNRHDKYVEVDSFTDHGHDHIGKDRGAEKHLAIGTNMRINELSAAVGLAQLKKLDKILEIQKKNKIILKSAIESINGIRFREIPDKKGDSATFLSFFMPNMDTATKLFSKFNKSNINGCFYWFNNNWHYIKQWSHLTSFMSLKRASNLSDYISLYLPKSNSIIGKTISIQIKLSWTTKEIERLSEAIRIMLRETI